MKPLEESKWMGSKSFWVGVQVEMWVDLGESLEDLYLSPIPCPVHLFHLAIP